MGKKIIHINAHGKYSTGKIATSIATGASNGSKLFYSLDKTDENLGTKFYSKLGWKMDLLLTRLTGRDSVWSWCNTRRIIKALKSEKPEIIHLHNLHGFYVSYKKLFKFIKKNDIKVVWTLHDCWSMTGHCTYFDYIGCEKWKTGCEKCPTFKETYLKSWLFDCSKSTYNAKRKAFSGVKSMVIVTPSEWLAGLVKQSILKDYPVKVINNGINTENFSITPNESFKELLPNGKKIVLAVASNWDKRKGFSDVVEVSRRLTEDYQVVMVGVTETQKQQLSNENIIAVTRTENQKQLAELYSSAHVFINTTYEDNYPTVNIEALCCGCPIITYATGGSVETVDDTNGIVVPKGNMDLLIKAIYDIGSKEFDRQAMSISAKETYSEGGMVKKYIELYEEMN